MVKLLLQQVEIKNIVVLNVKRVVILKQEGQKNGNFGANNAIPAKDVEVTPDIADFQEYADDDDIPF